MVIKVLIADDQALVRGALGALLELSGDIEVVAEVGRGDEVVAAARESDAQVCLLDVQAYSMFRCRVWMALRRHRLSERHCPGSEC